MKKILLTVAGSMFIALAAVNAQERSDTTKTKQSTQYRTQSGTQSQTSEIQGQSATQGQYQQWREDEREPVTREDLPEGLVSTLESDQYKGWENATIYRNKNSSDYMLVIQDNGETKTFYFDKEGKSIMDNQSPDQSNQEASGVSGQTSDQPSSSSSGQTSGSISATEEGVSASVNTTDPEWRKEDKIKIRTSQIPNSMLITLGDPMYKGWEKSMVYRNKSNNQYMIEIKDGSETKVYYFDKDGKALTSSPSHNLNDQSSSYNKDQHDQNGSYNTDKKKGDQQTTSSQWRNEDRVMVTSDEIPVTLRTTLSEDQYKGWENSSIYRNRATNEYMIEIRDGSATKTYYFDKNGNATNNIDRSDNQNQSNRDDKPSDKGAADEGGSGYSSSEQKIPTGNTTSGDSNWKDEDRIMITTSEIPSSLRATLSEDTYRGWESSTVYRNRNTNEYMVQIKDGSNVKTYYFDKSGKAITIESDDKD